ncbi:MAG: GNAT family N-acetyltransferase [Clostridia bacterium]|nr:GNAT family N-acetyltransferase [Clostridia bacterium]
MEYNIDALRIRLLVPEDKEKVRVFFSKLGEEGGTFFNRNRGNEGRTVSFCEGGRPDHIFWAAVHDTDAGEEIVGIVFLWNKENMVPWLGIGITEEWKGRHLGRRLIAAAREYCESVGAGGILLTTAQNNFRGQGLYEHCGFEKIGTYHDGEILYILRFPNEKLKEHKLV